MKKLYYFCSLLLFSFCLLVACSKNEPVVDLLIAPNLPDQVYNYSDLDLSIYSSLQNTFDDFEISDNAATLGRVLFYDTKLSATNRIACGSCHTQQVGFSDIKRFSLGFTDQFTTRNSMPISNMAFMRGFFWDLRTSNLNDLILMPIQNHIEMGMEDIDLLVTKLNTINYYPPLFEAAYGSEEITKDKISNSVAQFLRSMVSLNSKYDQGITTNLSNFSQLEKLGFEVFNGKAQCNNCHMHPIFDSRWETSANIGLELEYDDQGIGALEGSSSFKNGVFKIPSLRNIELTGPYMHDGRFNTLEEVVDHYNEGIQNHPSLDRRLRDNDWQTGIGGSIKINLDELEKMALVAFLKTLTDQDYLQDKKYSDPFR